MRCRMIIGSLCGKTSLMGKSSSKWLEISSQIGYGVFSRKNTHQGRGGQSLSTKTVRGGKMTHSLRVLLGTFRSTLTVCRQWPQVFLLGIFTARSYQVSGMKSKPAPTRSHSEQTMPSIAWGATVTSMWGTRIMSGSGLAIKKQRLFLHRRIRFGLLIGARSCRLFLMRGLRNSNRGGSGKQTGFLLVW